jgi:N-methylhydantoinase A
MTYRVGVDIGGTFTDFAVLDDRNKLYSVKVFSTPATPGADVLNGLRALRDRYGIEPADISYFTHGTTVGVNSIIQRNGAKLCLITTRHFQDVLELGRLRTPDNTHLFSLRPRPLVSKDRVFQVSGRMLYDGTEQDPLNETEAEAAIRAAVATETEGLVVALLNSYRNPAHEVRIREIAARIAPDLLVTCSSEVWAVIREYERTLTAVLNAYVRPKMARYLTSLQEALKREGVPAEPQITKSNGGVMRAELGKTACVDALLSGTASGVTGACFVAQMSGLPNVASFDVGGTSADIALIINGQPRFGTGERVGDFPLYIPSVSVSSIGGGGGSIARVDDHGVLKSGPTSAGSEPGPACYGRGGTLPTTTDAFVVCGFLGQVELAYGTVGIDRGNAEQAVDTIAEPLARSVREAAQNIIQVATSGMYAEMTRVFARHGAEPKSFALMAFGGAGPMIACFLAREAGMRTVLVPPTPGVLSALGGLVADTKNDFIHTVYGALDAALVDTLRADFAALCAQARSWFVDEQGRHDEPQLLLSGDLRYAGQSFEIETPIEAAWIDGGDVASIADSFHRQHQAIYNYSDPTAPVQVINVRVVVAGANTRPVFPELAAVPYTPTPERIVEVFYDDAPRQAGLYLRELLRPGARFSGPAIIAQSDTTTCVLHGYTVRVDGYGNIFLESDD